MSTSSTVSEDCDWSQGDSGSKVAFSPGQPTSSAGSSSLRDRRQLKVPKLANVLSAGYKDIVGKATRNDPTTSRAAQVAREFLREVELKEAVGTGAMSVVRLGVRKVDGLRFAVKCIRTEDEELRMATKREYKLAKQAKHPGIVQVYGLFELQTELYLCMELCADGSVESRVKQKGIFREPEGIGLMRTLLEGVHYLHVKRIVHRDIKPANLLLTNGERSLKITDFNTSKQIGGEEGLLLTDRGTHLYSAPELRFGRLWNERIDIWASGFSLYFMLKAVEPLNIYDTTSAAILQSGKLPRIAFEGISSLTRNLIEQCLTVDPFDRPPAMELLQHVCLEASAVGIASTNSQHSDADSSQAEDGVRPVRVASRYEHGDFRPPRRPHSIAVHRTASEAMPLNQWRRTPHQDDISISNESRGSDIAPDTPPTSWEKGGVSCAAGASAFQESRCGTESLRRLAANKLQRTMPDGNLGSPWQYADSGGPIQERAWNRSPGSSRASSRCGSISPRSALRNAGGDESPAMRLRHQHVKSQRAGSPNQWAVGEAEGSNSDSSANTHGQEESWLATTACPPVSPTSPGPSSGTCKLSL